MTFQNRSKPQINIWNSKQRLSRRSESAPVRNVLRFRDSLFRGKGHSLHVASVHRPINSSRSRSVTLPIPIGIAILDIVSSEAQRARYRVSNQLQHDCSSSEMRSSSFSLSLSLFFSSTLFPTCPHKSSPMKILRVKDKSANGGSVVKRRGYYWCAGGITLPLSFISWLRFPFFPLEPPAG